MDIKKELAWGIVLTSIILILIGFYFIQYRNRKNNQTTVAPTQTTTSALTAAEVAKHNNANDCWFVIENNVYDVTQHLITHPGGSEIMIPYCGQDATQAFLTKGDDKTHSQKAFQQLKSILIGPLTKQ